MTTENSKQMHRRSLFGKMLRRHRLRKLFRRKHQNVEKRTWKSRIAGISGNIIIALLILAAAVIIFFDQLLCFAITRAGSAFAGVEITIGNLETSWCRGDIRIDDLRVGNPEGFGDGDLLEISYVYILVDKSTIFSDKCVFKNIELRNISVHGKINCDGVLNLQKLSDHLWKYSDSSSSSGERFLLNRIRVDNLNASICDQREDSNITGTGITLKHADISLEKGIAELNDMYITPPEKYSGKLIELSSAALRFTPHIFYSEKPVLENIDIDGLHANIGLQGDGNSSVHEIFRSCSSLFFADGTPDSGETDGSGDGSMLIFDSFCFKNVSFSFRDDKHENSIHGFGVNFDKLSGSFKNGKLNLSGLQVNNPDGFNRNMFKIQSAEIEFVPDSIFSGEPEITMTKMDTIYAVIGFNRENQSNLYAVLHSLEQLFLPFSTNEPEVEQNDTSTPPRIGNFEFTNINLDVWDVRKERNINGCAISLDGLKGSVKDGIINISNLKISPPAGYNQEMLSIKSLDLQFIPESLDEQKIIITDLYADGLKATAGLKDPDISNISEVADAVKLFFQPLFKPSSEASGTTDEQDTELPFIVQNCLLKDCNFSVQDHRKKDNIQGFGISVGELNFNRISGKIKLHKFMIFNPHGYYRRYLLALTAADAVITENNGSTRLKTLDINGLHGVFEYKSDGKTNFHEIADAMFVIFHRIPPCRIREEKPAPPVKKEEYTLDHCKISNSSLLIWDARQRVPLRVPLMIDSKNYKMSSSDTPVLESIHNQATDFERELKDITSASKILLGVLNSTTESGVNFIKESTEQSAKFLQALFDFGN